MRLNLRDRVDSMLNASGVDDEETLFFITGEFYRLVKAIIDDDPLKD